MNIHEEEGKAGVTKDGLSGTPISVEMGTTCVIDKALERRVKRKIDWVIMPLMAFTFFSQYIDKQCLTYAAVFGIIEDLGLQGTLFAWTGAIFYAGQLASTFPCMYLMSRLPLARFVGVTIIVWGCICMCLAAVQTSGQLLAVRFLLGLAEGSVQPAFVTLTSLWYRKREHPVRIGIWISCNGVAQVFGPLIMYGIAKAEPNLTSWRVLFIICGALTVFCGIVFSFGFPSGPEHAWFLTPEEKSVAKQRLSLESEGGDRTTFSTAQFIEAFLDIRSWLGLLFGVLITLPAPVLSFASLIIHTLGYDRFETMLYTSPSGAVQITFIWVGIGLVAIWPHRRSAIIMGLIAVPLTGVILLFTLPLSVGWGMIVASWMASVISNIFTILLSLNASNIRGNTKKAIVNAMFFAGYAIGAMSAPSLWTTQAAPRYHNGLIMALVSWVALFAATGLYWWICWRDNKERDESSQDLAVVVDTEDLTDKQNRAFRYTY